MTTGVHGTTSEAAAPVLLERGFKLIECVGRRQLNEYRHQVSRSSFHVSRLRIR